MGPGSCKGLGSFTRSRLSGTQSLPGEVGGVQRQCGHGSGLGDPSELSSAYFLSRRSIWYCFEAEAASCLHGDIEGLMLFTLCLPCCALRGRTRPDSQSTRSPGFCRHRVGIYCMLVALAGLSRGGGEAFAHHHVLSIRLLGIRKQNSRSRTNDQSALGDNA